MGISINVSAKPDYSYLFQSLSTSSGSSLGNLSFLSDYASIKNGSYGKLMKAYYAKDSDSTAKTSVTTVNDKINSTNSISTASDSAKTLSEIEKSADAMKESADSLLTKGTKSVFTKKSVTAKDEYGFDNTTREYDTDAIYKAVSAFTQDYNNLLDKVADSDSTTILNKGTSLINMTKANEKLLSDIGITINDDNTLSIDEETFKKSDMNTVKSLFNDTGSYGYSVSAQASLIDYAAERESSKANTYTGFGTYSNSYSTGSILDSLF
ncbi:MAG: hypothetical protein ACI4ED_03150 [Suilimivivens sp.]